MPLNSTLKSSLTTFCTVILSGSLLGSLGSVARAQVFQDGQGAVEVKEQPRGRRLPVKRENEFNPRVGRSAASKYMSPQRPDQRDEDEAESGEPAQNANRSPAAGSADHYMAIQLGWFVTDNAYKWGIPESQNNVGTWNAGLSYRMGEWQNSMDLLIRFEASRIALAEGAVTKFSFLPVVTFPDATSRFPLYFGGGIGLGIFGTQIAGESSLALDYQLLAGARFFNIWDSTGLIIEGGIKNHFHLLSDGQFNGTFISTGLVFTF